MEKIPILCTESGSIYESLPDADPWIAERDAWRFQGQKAIVAHPPCGQWGRFRKIARTNHREKWLGPWCVIIARTNGGVIEHPAYSTLWDFMEMARPGKVDKFGGTTVAMWQSDFGHPCRKASWFYIVGLHQGQIPKTPISLEQPEFVIASRKDRGRVKQVLPEKLRSSTPPMLARWMMETAAIIESKKTRK